MRKISKKIYISPGDVLWTLTAILTVMLIISSYYYDRFLNNTMCIVLTLSTIAVAIVYSCFDFRNRYLFLGFNAGYYIFLVSGVASKLGNESEIVKYLRAGEAGASHACHCIALSVVVVDLVFYILDILTNRDRLNPISVKKVSAVYNIKTKQLIQYAFFASMLCKMVSSYIRFNYRLHSGYSSVYQFTIAIPAYIKLPASVFYFLLCLWLVSRPSKRQFIFGAVLTVLIEALVLFSGDRGESMTTLMIMVFYILIRSDDDQNFLHLKKRYVVLSAMSIPLVIYLLQYISYERKNVEMTVEKNVLSDFFDAQGISATIISIGYNINDRITEIGGKTYVTGTLRGYLLHNVLTRALFGTSAAVSNTAEVALSGESYGSTMAYVRFKSSYLKGIGCGTSYIAELWHDGGILFLIVGSILLGYLISVICKKAKGDGGLFSGAIFMLMSMNLLEIPRGNCFAWLTSTLSVNNLIVLAILAAANNLFVHKALNENHLGESHKQMLSNKIE